MPETTASAAAMAEQGIERQEVAHELDLLRADPQERNKQAGD